MAWRSIRCRVSLLATSGEQLGEDDLWYCPKCKDHVAAFKKFDLWTVPDVLIIHLKRFEYISGQYFMAREKIESLVDFPIESLDLREFTKGSGGGGLGVGWGTSAVFDLYAVSEHMGTQHGGHYTAVVKNKENGAWYSCNDSHVSETSPESSLTPNAYVLFYKRQGASARWGGLKKGTGTSGAGAPPRGGVSKPPRRSSRRGDY